MACNGKCIFAFHFILCRTLYIKQTLFFEFLKNANDQETIHEYKGKIKKMAFLIKYWEDTVIR